MKTLMIQKPGRVGILITESNGKSRSKAMRFKDSVAALRWCEANGATLIYMCVKPPIQN